MAPSRTGTEDGTQIHTRVRYSAFNAIIDVMAADVIYIKTSSSKMQLLDAFHGFRCLSRINPGVHDIRSLACRPSPT